MSQEIQDPKPTFATNFEDKFFRPLRVVLSAIFKYSWLTVSIIISLVPILWMISASFSDVRDISRVPIIPRITEWSLVNYQEIFTYRSSTGQMFPDYVGSFFVTLFVAGFSTVMVVLLSSLVGFAFTRYRFSGKKKVLLTMMTLQMFPSFMGMIALFLLFQMFGWLNNPLMLAFIYVAGAIPYNTFIVRGFMRNIPKTLDEAAAIDGATNLQIMLKIIVPLATPIMGFVAVTAFMAPWMDFILPSILMPQNETVAQWLFTVNDSESQPYDPMQFMAGALFLAVPIMAVQIYMQRYVVYGLTQGAEKG